MDGCFPLVRPTKSFGIVDAFGARVAATLNFDGFGPAALKLLDAPL